MPTLFDHILVFYFALVGPIYGATVSFPRFKRAIAEGGSTVRISGYRRGILWNLLWAGLVVLLWSSNHRDWILLGLGFPNLWLFLPLLLVGLWVVLGLRWFRRTVFKDRKEWSKSLKKFHGLVPILPHSKFELRWFVLKAVSTGISEEILFRGFLIWYLAAFKGYVFAFFVSSALFGFAHIYQGTKRAIRIAFLSLLFAAAFMVTESLWLSMFMHAAMNIHIGLLVQGILERSEQATNG